MTTEVQNEIVRAYNELRDELSRQAFGDKFDERLDFFQVHF